MEQVAGIADPLPTGPAHGCSLLRRRAARSRPSSRARARVISRSRRSSGRDALVPSTTRAARTRARSVRHTTSAPSRSIPTTGDCSCRRTPRSRHACRSPQASRAGSTITTSGSFRAARYVGDATRALVCSASSNRTGRPAACICSASSTTPATSCSRVATASSPVRSRPQSMPYRATVSTRPSMFSLPQPQQRRHLVRPARGAVGEPVGQARLGEPAVAPLAASPHRPASSTTTSRPGSRSLARNAVHNPV